MQNLTLKQVLPEQKQPPRRFIQALEKRGIGRPSTYAAILSNLKSREYMQIEQKRLVPTESGSKLLDYLLDNFAPILADDYTAKMEAALDEIAAGILSQEALLGSFWAGASLVARRNGGIAPARNRQPAPTTA